MKKKIINALLAAATVASPLANAWTCQQWSGHSYWEDGKSTAVQRVEYGDERVVAWQAPLQFVCNSSTRVCDYAYNQTVSTTVAFSVNLSGTAQRIDKTLGATLGFNVSYSRTVTDGFTWTTHLNQGDNARAAIIDVKHYKGGDIYGAWINSGQRCMVWGTKHGTKFNWDPNYFANTWGGHFHVRGPYVTYIINGRIPQV